MALQTKIINANGSKGHHLFTLTANENSTNIETNKSYGTYSFQISPTQNGWDWYGHNIPFSGNIGGTTFSGNISNYDGSSTVTLASGNFEIEHETDGNKTMGISFSVTDNTGASYTCGNANGSDTMTLTYIPRKTNFTQTDYGAMIGETSKFGTVKPASPTFTHTIKLIIGDIFTKYINGNTGEWSDTEIKFPTVYELNSNDMGLYFDANKDLYSLFTGTGITGILTLTTYNGDNDLGTSTANLVIQISASDCLPRLTSLTVYDNKEETYHLTGDHERIVANQSNVTLNFTIQISDPDDTSTTLTSLSINDVPLGIDDRQYLLDKPTDQMISFYLKNSRGLDNYPKVKINKWVPYVDVGVPSHYTNEVSRRILTPIRYEQIDSTTTDQSVYVSFISQFYDGYFDANEQNKNEFTLTYRYKKANDTTATWSDWYTLDTSNCERQNNYIDTNNLTGASNYVYLKDNSGHLIPFDYHSSYIIEYKMADKLTTFTNTVTLQSAVPVYSWNNYGIRVTDTFSQGGYTLNGVFNTYGLPTVTEYENAKNNYSPATYNDWVIAKGITSSEQFYASQNYKALPNGSKGFIGYMSLDATTLTAKQNNNWIIPTCWADIIYPVGSIYMNVNKINPKLLFGGEWTQIKGKFLVGVDTSDTDFNTSEKIGGSKTHSHIYGVEYNAYYAGLYSDDARLIRLYDGITNTYKESETDGSSQENGNSGFQDTKTQRGISKLNNKANTTETLTLPPYMTVYMWQRTT